MKRKFKKVVLGLLAHITPSICFGRILWGEALVYNSYIFSEQPFYGNYSTIDSHKNTVISHAFAYSSRWDRDKVFCLDIIENFYLILNNYCFFRITVEYVKLTLRPSQDGASSDHTQQ